jgi:excisionase family DNA binding protein
MRRRKAAAARAAYLTRSDVARLLAVAPTTVTRWAHEGLLPYQLTLGGHHRFEPDVIERLRRDLRRAATRARGGA